MSARTRQLLAALLLVLVPAGAWSASSSRPPREPAPLESAGQYAAPAGAPYVAEEVVVSLKGYSLAGTLTRPRTTHGRLPAVLLITGAAPQDRDNTIGLSDYRPFREIADTLVRHGIVTLRLDDRGVGASTGSLENVTTLEKTADADAALAFLRARSDIDGARLALLGHSEGAMVATLVAARDKALRGLVLISSPAESGREMVSRQNRKRAESDSGIPDGMRDSAYVLAMQAWDERAASDGWTAFFSAHEPLKVAKRVHTPVLLLQGGADENLGADDAEKLAAAFRSGGDKDVRVMKLDGLMHSMLRADSFGADGSVAPGGLELPAEVLGALVDWLKPHLR